MEQWEQIGKPLRDLIAIIHFTENVSAKMHGVLDEAAIYRAVMEGFAQSKRYTASILLLADGGSKLRIVETSVPPGKLKAGEKAAGVRLKGYKIDLNKSSIYSQVVREGKTVQVNVSDIIGELFPRPLAHLISKTMGYEKRSAILTPLKRHGKIVGALAMTSTELAEHFIPSVRNLAQHISNALELADEYAERKGAEEELRKYRDHLEELVEERTAELIKANEQLQREITERKQAEEALRRERDLIARIAETSPAGIAVVNREGRITFANAQAERVLGLARDEITQRTYNAPDWRITDYDGGPFPDEQLPFRQVMDTGRPVSDVRHAIEWPDGRRVLLSINATPVFDESGQVDGMVATVEDITERKRAERLLQALNEAALAMQRALTHEEMFATVAEELKKLDFSCMVFPMDESQSRLVTKYLSYEIKALKAAEKLVGLKHEDFSIPIETVDIYRKVVWEKKTVFVHNVEDIMRQVLPEPLKRFTGQIVRMLKVPKSIPAPLIVEDKVIGVFSVQSDDLTEDDIPAITAFAHQMAAAWRKANLMQDLQRSLEELKRTQAQLLQAQKMEAIGQLAGGIVHDFNNLLTPINGFAELLLRKAAEGSQQQEYLRQIKTAAERAAALTRQLRLFTRQAVGERCPVQLNSVVEETRGLLERSMPKEVTIGLSLEPELWTVEADPSQISQVLLNLCLNARDAMPDDGSLTLETRNVTLDEEQAQVILEARPGRYVCLSVSDTGCGMSLEVQARLFEPFFTTKEVGEGMGLGLAVVYGIVKGHDGFINVNSEEGRGSTFHVYLPAIELAAEKRQFEMLELPTGTETVLLVDDEETIRKLGERVLKQCGYTVLTAENGVQALEMYQAHKGEIALVVLDVIMPQMSGRECLRGLRELDPQVKVLISTGYTANSSAQKLLTEGALEVVEKPFLLQDFATAVRAALNKL